MTTFWSQPKITFEIDFPNVCERNCCVTQFEEKKKNAER